MVVTKCIDCGSTEHCWDDDRCPTCHDKLYKSQRDARKRAHDKKYKTENKDKIKKYYQDNKARIKKYYDDNKTHILKRQNDAKLANPQARKDSQRRYRERNKDKVAESHRRYMQTDVGKTCVKSSAARGRYKDRDVGKYTHREWLDTLEHFDNTCAYCGIEWYHRDHVVPLSKGGMNQRHNVIPACARCNTDKNRRLIEDWYPAMPFYDEARMNKILEYTRTNEVE